MRASDRVTVLRRGHAVATLNTCDTTMAELATLMVGRPVVLDVERQPHAPGDAVIAIEGITIQSREHRLEVRDLSLTVRAGEVVTVCGVAGNGQGPLVEALFGLRRPSEGKITILGQDLAGCRPCDLVRLNVGRIPEDRQTTGLALGLSVCENLVLEVHAQEPYCRRGVLRHGEIRRLAQELGAEYDIRISSIDLRVGTLSGGNQQKVILARALHRAPRAFVAVDPTRGLDVGATEFIYRQILAARDRGVAVLLVSTDLEEALCLSDRIAVIYNGQIMGILPTAEANETRIGLMMAGVRQEDLPETPPPERSLNACSPQP
jgi:simple sugar transport system ATP-binding protein